MVLIKSSGNDLKYHNNSMKILQISSILQPEFPIKISKRSAGLENIFLFLAAKFKNTNFLCKSNIKLPAYLCICRFQRTYGAAHCQKLQSIDGFSYFLLGWQVTEATQSVTKPQ
jgi:hypothetical protein